MARESLMCSPIVTALDTDAAEAATLTVSESGVAHIGRMCTFAALNSDVTGYSSLDLSNTIDISGLLFNGATELIRGRNTPAPPGAVFSPYRNARVVDLGDWSMQAGDTIRASVEVQGTGIVGDFAFAVPFSPKNARPAYVGAIPQGQRSWAGSPTVELAAAATGNVTFTADQDGLVFLGDMVIRCTLDAAANGAFGPEELSALALNQITLPSGTQLILGQNTPSAPSAIFRYDRPFNWDGLGAEWVSAGSTIILNFTNDAPDQGNISFGFPFIPSRGDRPC